MATITTSTSLTIEHYNNLQKKADDSPGLSLIITGDGTDVKTNEKGEACNFNISLISVEIEKKVYQPNFIDALIKISASSENLLPRLNQIKTIFLRKRASLSVTVYEDSKQKDVIEEKGYFVYEICPQYKKSSTTEIEVRLMIYSMDKLMTLDKYSQTYLGRKLRRELLNSVKRFQLGYDYLDSESTTKKDTTAVQAFDDKVEEKKSITYSKPEYDKKGNPKKDDSGEIKMKVITETQNVNSDKVYLQHLAYDEYLEIKYDSKNQKNIYSILQHEFIQPYLVQYNESFYDFLVRVANRCGEFLYFEDGKIVIGLPAKPSILLKTDSIQNLDKEKYAIESKNITATTIQDYSTISFQNISAGSISVSDYYRDSLKDKKSSFDDFPKDNHSSSERKEAPKQFYKETGEEETYTLPDDVNFSLKDKKADQTYVYNSEIAADEFFMPLFKDGFGGTKWWELSMGTREKQVAHATATALSSTSLYDLITEGIIEYVEMGIQYGIYKKYRNQRGNNRFIKPYSPTNIKNVNNDIFTEDPDAVVPFSENEIKRWTTLEYYSDIRKFEEQQERQMIEVNMDSNLRNIKLGDFIKVNGSDDYYIVCEVNLSIGTSKNQTFKAIPMLGYSASSSSSGSPDYLVAFPPVSKEGVFRKSGPQTAFITDTADPKRQGRVRIRYPWQSNNVTIEPEDVVIPSVEEETWKKYNQIRNEAASPWVRMTMPSATEDAGIYFEPEPGDEVLVNYENSNVERPCVVGALYSKNALSPSSKGRRVLVSKYGHMIRFKDPSDGVGEITDSTGFARFMESVMPLYGALSFFFPDKMPSFENSQINKMTGGIDIGDAYGLYKISMSSDERAIKILSPFGTVTLNAFTGIKISAPNGNIELKGKNIDIIASNKVNIKSGTNISQGNYFKSEIDDGWDFLDALKETVLEQSKRIYPIDVSLLRNFLEIFFRPIDGTLSLKTFGFLKLEAGKGSAQIPKINYSDWYLANEDKNLEIYQKLTLTHKYIEKVIDKINDIVEDHMEEVFLLSENLNDQIQIFIQDFVRPEYFKNIDTEVKFFNLLFSDNVTTFSFDDPDFNGNKMPEIYNVIQQSINEIPEQKNYKAWLEHLNKSFVSLRNSIRENPTNFDSLININTLKDKVDRPFQNATTDQLGDILKNALTITFNNDKYLFELTKKLLSTNDRRVFFDMHQDDPNGYRDLNQWYEKKKLLKREILKEFFMEYARQLNFFDLTFDGNVDVSSDNAWDNAMNGFKLRFKPNANIPTDYPTRFMSYFFEDYKTGISRDIWEKGTGVVGKILMSEDKDKTVMLDNNGHFTVENNKTLAEMEDVAIAFENRVRTKVGTLN